MPMLDEPKAFHGYLVYSDGRIWRNEHVYIRSGDVKVVRKPGWVSTRIRQAGKGNGGGYVYVDLRVDGSPRTYLVHRLVAQLFVPNTDDKPDVNHKDGNRANNHAANLEWVTKSENQLHAYRTGVRSDVGEAHRMAKVTNRQAKAIWLMRNILGFPLKQIAALHDICFQTVSRISKGGHHATARS